MRHGRWVRTAKRAGGPSGPLTYIEPRRYSVASCVAYVSKKETRQAGPFIHGDFDMHEDQGKRTDLEELRDAVVKGASVNEILNDPELSLKAARFMPWLEKMVGAQQAARFSQEDREVTVHYLWGWARREVFLMATDRRFFV